MDLDLESVSLDVANKSHRFKEAVRIHPQGSITLGMLTTVLCVKDALGNGQDLKIGLPGIAVRITAPRQGSDPHPRIEFSTEEYSNGNRSGRAAHYWTDNAASRSALTQLVFALPEVMVAFDHACTMLERGETGFRTNAESVLAPEAAARLAALSKRA